MVSRTLSQPKKDGEYENEDHVVKYLTNKKTSKL